jgi:hypothetical protein
MMPIAGDFWTVNIRRDPNVDFCVWILLQDGLHASPFDQHPGGDGGLKRVGLTDTNWREWFRNTVRTIGHEDQGLFSVGEGTTKVEEVDLAGLLTSDGLATPDQLAAAKRELLERTSAGHWPSQNGVREELLRRWPEYMRRLKRRADSEFRALTKRHQLIQGFTTSEVDDLVIRERRFWDQLQQFRPLPTLYFYCVDYLSPVTEAIPPASAVLGGVDPDADWEEFSRQALEATARLKISS